MSFFLFLFAGLEDKQDESVETEAANHGGQNGTTKVVITQLSDLKSFGDLTPGLAEAEARVQELGQTAVKTNQEKPGLDGGRHFQVRLLEHRHLETLSADSGWSRSSGRGRVEPAGWCTATTLISLKFNLKKKKKKKKSGLTFELRTKKN